MRSEPQQIHPGELPPASIDNERRRAVVQHTPRVFALFWVFVGLTGLLEWILRPANRPAAVLVAALYLAFTLAHLSVVRFRPQWSVASIVVTINGLCAGILTYSILVHGKGELVVMVLCVMLGAFATMFPIGAGNQVLASLTALVGYPLALQLGTTLVSAWGYSSLALIAFVTVFVVGASLIDEFRARILRDASSQAALARDNARLVEEARAADRAKSEFLSTVSHELRTPLSVIVGYSDLLLDNTFEAQEQPAIQRRIREQADLMLNLVQALLDLNRISSGKPRLNIEAFDLGELEARLRRNLPSSWRNPAVELHWSPAGEPIAMLSDPGKLEMILRNLIHNALKYTREGSVTVSTEPGPDDTVCFKVADTGEGIAADDLPTIFAMFDQGAHSAPRGGGVGLGLYIVKRFTEVLGGTVSVESTPGKGTSFRVTLPRTIDDSEPVGADSGASPA